MADKSPDAFRTISEVADWLGVQPHVLRFWESKFSQVKPVKRAGGRRYYRPNDMLLLGGIRKLLHEDGLTIKGAQKVLREEGMAHVAAMSGPLDEETSSLAVEASAQYETASSEPTPQDNAPTEPAQHDMEEAPFVDALPEETSTVAPFETTSEIAPQDVPQTSPTPMATMEAEETAPDPIDQAVDAPLDTATESEEEISQEAVAETIAETVEQTQIIHTDPDPVESTPVHPVGSAPAFEDFEVSSDTLDVTPADTEDPMQEDMFPETAAQGADEELAESAAHEPEGAFAEPSFSRSEPEHEPEYAPAPEPVSDTEPDLNSEPVNLPEPELAPDPDPVLEAAKPHIVDAPDPDESTLTAAPSALSKVFGATKIDSNTQAQITPLVAQLAALRDRMAAARGQ